MGLGRLLWELLTVKRVGKTAARLGVTVVACGVTVGIALTVGVATGSNQENPATSQTASSMAKAVTSGLASSYGFLTSPSATAMPASLGSDLGWAGGYGVNPSLAREAGIAGGEYLWLVPGSSETCLELDSGYSSCGSNTLVQKQGVWLELKPVSGAAPTMYGIVPDGATVSGDAASATVSQSGNAVMVTPSSSTPGQFAIHTSSGATVDMSIPGAAGAPQ